MRALSFYDALDKGLDPIKYSYRDIPENFIGTLDFKVWGKRQNLKLYFSSECGNKYVLSVFFGNYSPENMPDFDLSSELITHGMRFDIKTRVNSKGNYNLFEIVLLG